MKSKIRHLRQKLERKKGQRDQIEKSLERNRSKLQQLEEDLVHSKQAQTVIQEVAKTTQQELEYHLSDLVSLAMASVFPDPYKLKCDFVSRRGKIEVDMFFDKKENLIDPMTSTGGGAVDVASLALRFSSWTLKNPRTRPIVIMDEPLKWLKGSDLPEKGSDVIKKISQKLNLQIIMVSHDPELINSADKVIQVEIKQGISRVA